MAGKRVLIVDDEAQVLSTLAAFVTRAGFTVETATKFEDAKRLLTTDPPDILVTDVRLGPYNGLQLVLLMREARPEGRIVVLSAFDDPTLRQEASRYQAEYILKPLSGQALIERLSATSGSS